MERIAGIIALVAAMAQGLAAQEPPCAPTTAKDSSLREVIIIAEQSGLRVSRRGVLVTAFGANPDGHGTLLRVWEQAGQSGQLTVMIPGEFTTATPVNLRGEITGQRCAIAADQLVFPLGAYAPASWVLE